MTQEQQQQQINEVMRELTELRAENTVLSQQVAGLQHAAAAAGPNGRTDVPHEILNALAELPNAIRTAARGPRSLIDTRGLGRPPAYNNNEADFYVWSRKFENYAASVVPECRALLSWSAESTSEVTIDYAAGELILTEALVREASEMLYIALQSLTDGESFDIVASAGAGEGLESWRRLARRWDPYTSGRARSLLKDILAPTRCKMSDLMAGVEKLEDLMRRYTNRRDATGARLSMAEDIRMASLESLLPPDLEKHVQMNRARLSDYVSLRHEIVAYSETRAGAARQQATASSSNAGGGGVAPMDLDAFYKAKGKGKGKSEAKNGSKGKTVEKDKGKEDRECWNCGRKGHLSKDCWTKKSDAKGGRGAGRSKGKGKSKNEKSAHTLEAEATGTMTDEPEKEMGVLDISTMDANTADVKNDTERNGSYTLVNVDTGAGASAWPAGWPAKPYGSSRGIRFRTATGEYVEGGRDVQITATDEYDQRVRFKAVATGVHKPLLSAGEVTDNGNMLLLYADGGYLFKASSALGTVVRRKFEEKAAETDYDGTVRLHKQNGVYNMKLKIGPEIGAAVRDLCGQEADDSGGAAASSSGGVGVDPQPGGRRQGYP